MANAREQDLLSDDSETVIPLRGVHRFVASHLGYDLEIVISKKVPWWAVLTAALVFFLSLVSIVLDIQMLSTVGGLHRFIESTADVSGNSLRSTRSWINDQTGDVVSRVSEVDARALEFVSKCDQFAVALPNIDAYRQQLIDGDDAAWDTVMPQLQKLNGTVTELSGYVHDFVVKLGPISDKIEKSARHLERSYTKEVRTFSKNLEMEVSTTTQDFLASSMNTVTWLRKTVLNSIKDATVGVERAEKFLETEAGVSLPPIDEHCINEVMRGVDVLHKVSPKEGSAYVQGLVENASKNLQAKLDVTEYLQKSLDLLDSQMAVFTNLDNNFSSLMPALGKIDMKENVAGAAGEATANAQQALKQARQASANIIITSLDQVKPLLLSFKPAVGETTAPLVEMLHKVNATCRQVESYGNKIDDIVEKEADFLDSVNTRFVDPLFNQDRIWPLLRDSILIFLVGAFTAYSGRYIAQVDDHMEELMDDGNEDATKGLCAFYEHAHDLDTTAKDRAIRPMQRLYLRVRFLWMHSRCILMYLIFLFVVVILLLTHFVSAIMDEAVMYFISRAVGDVCWAGDGSFASEDPCAAPFNKISEALGGAQILPGGSCGSAGLLVCDDFFKPMDRMLYWDIVLKCIAVIGVMVIAFGMPSELRACYSRQVEMYVDRKAPMDLGDIMAD
eukprot:TRINITY_DN88058_c0_g1_i1.p1 TRINITY_DN88058_c0_g1~~TRINITY_DN88058_c0_g1_i1.p1  ORF type:complete len:674 (+),score=132.16 TRINITY_DN88058_c0_g1_i1:72-2093(+)